MSVDITRNPESTEKPSKISIPVPVILIIAGWAPELIVQRHTVLGARAPARLQPGCTQISPILGETLNFSPIWAKVIF